MSAQRAGPERPRLVSLDCCIESRDRLATNTQIFQKPGRTANNRVGGNSVQVEFGEIRGHCRQRGSRGVAGIHCHRQNRNPGAGHIETVEPHIEPAARLHKQVELLSKRPALLNSRLRDVLRLIPCNGSAFHASNNGGGGDSR